MERIANLSSSAVVSAIYQTVSGLPAERAICLVFAMILGRLPDSEGAGFYGPRFEGPVSERLSVIREIMSSEEAKRYGLMRLVDTDENGSGEVDGAVSPALIFASLGIANRRIAEQGEKLANIEEIARLTLLSVPEWCGSAYDKLDQRIANMERQLSGPREEAVKGKRS